MITSPKFVIGLLILAAVLAMLVLLFPGARLVLYEKKMIDYDLGSRVVVGWGWRPRWEEFAEPQGVELYDAETGFKIYEENFWNDVKSRRASVWSSDGKLLWQHRGFELRERPPWYWGRADQSAPSAPWIGSGIGGMEWYRRNSTSP